MEINWVPLLLLLHVLGAIVAFGPTYIFPIIGGMGAKEPMHAPFATRVSKAISDRVVIPLAVFQAVTGVLLILAAGWDLTEPRGRWLISAIVLYVIALGYATTIQSRNVRRIIELMEAPRPADAPPGPPPGLPQLAKAIQRGGMLLITLITLIVLLMVLKPSF
jgi:uncharacterized membrane protein